MAVLNNRIDQKAVDSTGKYDTGMQLQSAINAAANNAVANAQTNQIGAGVGLEPTVPAVAGTGSTSKPKTTAAAPVIPDQWQNGYSPSQNVLDAQNYLKAQEQAIADMGNYNGSPYDQDITNAYNAIMNRGPFRYNVNDDALYQQYRKLYAENGRQASLNAQGQAAGLTGGYGNSYAAAAGNAAYDQYMTQLNDRALDLYDRAYQRWTDEGERQLQGLNTSVGMADRDYNRWTDAYNRALAERDYAYGRYGDEYNRDYTLYTDQRDRDYGVALAMIKAGVTPPGQMLRNAGISDADYAALKKMYTPKKKSSGSGGTKKTGLDAVEDYINQQVDAGKMTPEDAIATYQYITGQGTSGTAAQSLGNTGARTVSSAKIPNQITKK